MWDCGYGKRTPTVGTKEPKRGEIGYAGVGGRVRDRMCVCVWVSRGMVNVLLPWLPKNGLNLQEIGYVRDRIGGPTSRRTAHRHSGKSRFPMAVSGLAPPGYDISPRRKSKLPPQGSDTRGVGGRVLRGEIGCAESGCALVGTKSRIRGAGRPDFDPRAPFCISG